MKGDIEIPRNWSFRREDVARSFDAHVREQLPWYDLATGAIAHIARHYISDGGLVYDLGASTGNISRAIAPTLLDRGARCVNVEQSQDMLDRFDGVGEVVLASVEDIGFERFDLAVLFLTLMFVAPARRADLIARLRSAARPGGAIVIFDKVEARRGYLSTVLWRLTLAGKVAAGVPSDEILAKELSLAGVQRPLRSADVPDDAVEWFRFGDFAGWVIET